MSFDYSFISNSLSLSKDKAHLIPFKWPYRQLPLRFQSNLCRAGNDFFSAFNFTFESFKCCEFAKVFISMWPALFVGFPFIIGSILVCDLFVYC